MIALTDKEILDEIEVVIDRFVTDFYQSDDETFKHVLATYYIGLVSGILMKREK